MAEYEAHPDIKEKMLMDILDIQEDLSESYYKIYEKLERRCWCTTCLAEIEVNQARREGKPDPFPVFERTLTCEHAEEIQALRNHLTSRFQFTRTILLDFDELANFAPKDAYAVFTRPGRFTGPFTLEIYYVISREEQEAIVEIVKGFLRDKEKNQVKIRFIEAEVPERYEVPDWKATGVRKGKEKLLREVAINY